MNNPKKQAWWATQAPLEWGTTPGLSDLPGRKRTLVTQEASLFMESQESSASWPFVPEGGRNDLIQRQRILIARAASSATVAKEIVAWIIMASLAQRERTGESVGEKAVLVLNARNR